MRYRQNTRSSNLAVMGKEKQEEDIHFFSGLLAIGSYFEKLERQETKVSPGSGVWQQHNIVVPRGEYMYAVGPNGALYISTNTSVHSQFKGGRAVQSAGHVTYDPAHPSNTIIDNYSGHYRPTLSQFLSTVYGLYKEGYLPAEFSIKLNPGTTNDYSFDQSFWKKIETSGESVTVKYMQFNDAFEFVTASRETLVLSREQLLEKGDFAPKPDISLRK